MDLNNVPPEMCRELPVGTPASAVLDLFKELCGGRTGYTTYGAVGARHGRLVVVCTAFWCCLEAVVKKGVLGVGTWKCGAMRVVLPQQLLPVGQAFTNTYSLPVVCFGTGLSGGVVCMLLRW